MLTRKQELEAVAQWIVDRSNGLYKRQRVQAGLQSGGPWQIYFDLPNDWHEHEVQVLHEGSDRTAKGLHNEKNKIVIKLLEYWKDNEQAKELLGDLLKTPYEPPPEQP